MSQLITTPDIQISDTLTFSLIGTTVTGISSLETCKVLGITSGEALRNPSDAAATHAALYPSMLSGVIPNDYRKYDYLLLQRGDGSLVEIGLPWINPLTLLRISANILTIVIKNFPASDALTIRELLLANGYAQVQLTIT